MLFGFVSQPGNQSTSDFIKQLQGTNMPTWFKLQQAEIYNSNVDKWNYTTPYSYSIKDRAYVHYARSKIDLSIFMETDSQVGQTIRKTVGAQSPANPGIRTVQASTYGATVPVSIGRRAVTGHIVDADPIMPHLVGAYSYVVRERVPVYGGGGPD